jgi:hypothetical protein
VATATTMNTVKYQLVLLFGIFFDELFIDDSLFLVDVIFLFMHLSLSFLYVAVKDAEVFLEVM